MVSSAFSIIPQHLDCFVFKIFYVINLRFKNRDVIITQNTTIGTCTA